MCFNSKVSIITYIIGILGSLQLYKNNHIPESIFYGWVVQMQLIEFFLWRNQPCQGSALKNNINTTKIGTIINHLEPIVLWISIIYFSKLKLPKEVTTLMIVFTIITLYYTRNVLKNVECTTVTEESKPHLHWKWNQGKNFIPYYALFLISLVALSYYGLPRGNINAGIILLSFVLSLLIYGKKHSTGAVWCFAASFAPWILTGLYKL